jgi:lysophospholipase L1-like esterase
MGKLRRSLRLNEWFQRNTAYFALALVGVVAAGAAAFWMNWPTPTSPSVSSGPAVTATPIPPPEPIRVAAVGDSITAGNSPDFAAGQIGDGSWLSYVLGNGVVFGGGWASAGARTPAMLSNVAPADVDVLVVLAGTNDITSGANFDIVAENISAIVSTVGAPRVIISAIPPYDLTPDRPVEFNTKLREFAAASGWEWVDPMGGIRNGTMYAAGMSPDGIHPNPRAAASIGAAIRVQILRDRFPGD